MPTTSPHPPSSEGGDGLAVDKIHVEPRRTQVAIEPERRETIRITLKLDRGQAHAHAQAIQTLVPEYGKYRLEMLRDGDTMRVCWDFNANYYGDICRSIEAVEEILTDQGVIRSASVEELIHGRSMVMDMAAKLDRLIQTISGPTSEPFGRQPEKREPPSKRESWWRRLFKL
jgi:hypothetical protein